MDTFYTSPELILDPTSMNSGACGTYMDWDAPEGGQMFSPKNVDEYLSGGQLCGMDKAGVPQDQESCILVIAPPSQTQMLPTNKMSM